MCSIMLSRHILWELVKATFISVTILTVLLLYGNLTRYEDVFFKAFEQNSTVILDLTLLLLPYAISMAIPFGYTIALALLVGRWASHREVVAVKSLGVSSVSLALPIYAYSCVLSMFGMFATLEWGPVNRAEFDKLREQVLWENLSHLLVEEGEVSFPIDQNSDDQMKKSFSSLLDKEAGEVNRVTLSVSEFSEEFWKNLRITFFDHQNRILMVINSGQTFVTKSIEKGFLTLDLHQVDLEPVHSHDNFFRGGSDLFLKVSHWNQPLVLKIGEGKKKNFKRLGFIELYNKSMDSKNMRQRILARSILHKNAAVGAAPFFITLLVLPTSIILGRKEGILNLFFGIVICVSFYVIGTIGANFFENHIWSYLAWWIPNLFFLFLSILFTMRSIP